MTGYYKEPSTFCLSPTITNPSPISLAPVYLSLAFLDQGEVGFSLWGGGEGYCPSLLLGIRAGGMQLLLFPSSPSGQD